MHETQSWFAGVDWASQKHDVWLADASGKRLGKRTFEHSGKGLAQMCDWLIATSGGKPEDIHIAIEVPHGAYCDLAARCGLIKGGGAASAALTLLWGMYTC